MTANNRHTPPRQPASAMDARALKYRRDFRTIYVASLSLGLVAMPLRRLCTFSRRQRGRKVTMWHQARTDAGIVASYALMGF